MAGRSSSRRSSAGRSSGGGSPVGRSSGGGSPVGRSSGGESSVGRSSGGGWSGGGTPRRARASDIGWNVDAASDAFSGYGWGGDDYDDALPGGRGGSDDLLGGRDARGRSDGLAGSRSARDGLPGGSDGRGDGRAGSRSGGDGLPGGRGGSYRFGGDEVEAPGDPESVARLICLRLLTAAPRTRAQLSDALRRRGVPADAAESVLSRFTEVGLIDDATFATAWVESRHYGRGLGRRALAAELSRRGVDRGDIEAAVEQLSAETERETALALVERRLPHTTGPSEAARVKKLVGLLARKGYSAGFAYSVVKEAIERAGQDAEGLDAVGLEAGGLGDDAFGYEFGEEGAGGEFEASS
jgi:regulatory protein